ncbi:pilin [Vibrio sp. 10N]|uniref:pilin n=1 Tax=Vibrio sp. 10N TaxID=3058938 RepID=UPI0028140D25|nr:type 4a pilus biogenesis protein PilA [Vibrio sp. 10N]
MKKATKQQGFTLIELMIVVAVIGVLAAVALPQYQNYVAKSELSSALATLSGLKTNTETLTLENGTFPPQSQSAAVGIPKTTMGDIELEPDAGVSGAGAITFTFAAGKVSPDLANKAIQLSRDQNGNWECKTTSSIPDGLKSKGCKNNI